MSEEIPTLKNYLNVVNKSLNGEILINPKAWKVLTSVSIKDEEGKIIRVAPFAGECLDESGERLSAIGKIKAEDILRAYTPPPAPEQKKTIIPFSIPSDTRERIEETPLAGKDRPRKSSHSPAKAKPLAKRILPQQLRFFHPQREKQSKLYSLGKIIFLIFAGIVLALLFWQAFTSFGKKNRPEERKSIKDTTDNLFSMEDDAMGHKGLYPISTQSSPIDHATGAVPFYFSEGKVLIAGEVLGDVTEINYLTHHLEARIQLAQFKKQLMQNYDKWKIKADDEFMSFYRRIKLMELAIVPSSPFYKDISEETKKSVQDLLFVTTTISLQNEDFLQTMLCNVQNALINHRFHLTAGIPSHIQKKISLLNTDRYTFIEDYRQNFLIQPIVKRDTLEIVGIYYVKENTVKFLPPQYDMIEKEKNATPFPTRLPSFCFTKMP